MKTTNTRPIPDELLDLQTVMLRTKLGYSTLRGYIASGRLPAYRIGRQLRVAEADVNKMFAPVKPQSQSA